MSKTTKKNNAAIEWPSNTHFTINDIFEKYPDFVEITVRFRVNRAIDNKEIVSIGKIKPAIGRPRLVFAVANPSAKLLEAAKAAGVVPIEEKTSTVTVAEMTAQKKTEKKVEVAAPVTTQTTVTV